MPSFTVLALGETLSDVVMRDFELQKQLEGTLSILREDKDNDVRCSAGGDPLQRCLTANSDSSGSEDPWFQDQDNHPSVELKGCRDPGFQQPSAENEGLQDVNSMEDSVFEMTQQFNDMLVVEKKEEEGRKKEEVEMFPSSCSGCKVVQISGGEVVKWTKVGSRDGERGPMLAEGECVRESVHTVIIIDRLND